MAKRYALFLYIWLLGIATAFGQTGCLYGSTIYTGGSIYHSGAGNYGLYSGSTPLGTKCASGTQTPCRVYYDLGANDYYNGLESDYSNLNCPLDNGGLGFLLSIGVMGYFMIRYKLPN